MIRKLMHSTMATSLSRRAVDAMKEESFIASYFSQVRNNRFHPENNPQGIADLGLAENKLCMKEWNKKLSEVAAKSEDQSLMFYDKATGRIELKNSLKKFVESRFHARQELLLDNIFITNGVTVILEALAFAFADPGDYIMVPAPYYYRIKNDLFERPGIHVLEVPLPLRLNERNEWSYENSVTSYEEVLKEAENKGKKVKALMLVNPHNPTGEVLTIQQLQEILQFAHRNNLHVIANEIYGFSVFKPQVQFTSILSVPHPDPEKVHFMWGFSKDFGLSGYRCALLYTRNQQLSKYIGLTAIYFRATGLIQFRLKSIIDDNEWLDNTLFPIMKKRLCERFSMYKQRLEEYDIKVYPSHATIFIWANFTKYLPEETFAAEKWLFQQFLDAGVFILPGESCYSREPGWFRIVSALDDDVNDKGLERMIQMLEKLSKEKRELN
ncbi:hypothetical protein Btru_055673 [Bulinus truncatus]|nr:hypothetical protein Btru_055673 [Bulinus truncatus]